MPATIAYVAPWVTIGGADKAVLDWFRRIDRERFCPILVTTQESDNELLDLVVPHAFETHALPWLVAGRDMAASIAAIIESRDVSVVHVMNSRLGFDILPALRSAFPRLATVVQLHAEEDDQSGYVRYVTGRYDDAIDAYSVVSHDLRGRLVRSSVDPEKVEVIYLGVDATDEFTPGPAPNDLLAPRRDGPGLEILFACRLAEQKDPLLMVRVAAALRSAGSTARIHVVGDGPLGAEVERAVSAAALEDRVLLHGASTEMRDWYRATDAVLLTSRFEGIPLVAYEAMACARPVVAPSIDAIGELVDDTTGVLVHDRADVDGYVAGVLTLERDPARRREMGRAGRERICSSFTLEQMIAGHERLYERVIAARAGEPAGRFDPRRWARWAPPATLPLWLDVVNVRSGTRLVASASPPRGAAWMLVGRVWTQPFADTVPLVMPRLGDDDPTSRAAPGDAPQGYVRRDPLPGMVQLKTVLGPATPDSPLADAWIEPPAAPPGGLTTWASLPPS